MNPNVTLAQIRTHIREATRQDHLDVTLRDGVVTWHLTEACHLTEDLDAWLSKGGFLPDDWNHAATYTAEYARTLTPSEREEQGYTRAQ